MRKILLCLFLSGVTVLSRQYDDDCPEIVVLADVMQIQKDLSLKFYNTPLKNTNKNTEQILELLTYLLDSEDCYQRNIAYTVSLWISQFLRQKTIPKLCPIAQLINASVSGDLDQLKCALEDIGDFEGVLSLYRLQNSIEAAGCCSNTSVIQDLRFHNCYASGLVYEIDILWERRGNILPSEYNDLVKNLYSSKSILDRLIALFTSYTLTSEFQRFSEKFPIIISLQATSYQYSNEIPQHCCENRRNILKSLSDDTSTEAKEIFTNMIPNCICPKLCFSAEKYSTVQRNVSITILNKMGYGFTIARREIYEELGKMIDSNNPRYNKIALQTLVMYEIFSKNIKQLPSLCSFAAVINGTVAYSTIGSNKKMKIALDGLTDFAPYYIYLNQITSIYNSKCKLQKSVIEPCTKLQNDCYEDGFVYNINHLWSLKVKEVPEGLQNKVQALYTSKSRLDNLLALILSFSITDFSFIFWENCDLSLLYQSVSGLSVDSLDKCCCVDYLENLSKLSEKLLSDIFKVISIVKDLYEIV